MTLRETELIGNALVKKLGFRRNKLNHNVYNLSYQHIAIEVEFYAKGTRWGVNVVYHIDTGTVVTFHGTAINIDNIIPDADKLIGMFYFIRL
jgi:hypothetical protein